jgi:large subunit ribosomal protein L25
MEMRTIRIETRTESGSGAVSRLRRAGFIPAVVYGEGAGAKNVRIAGVEFRKSFHGSSSAQLFQFKSDDSALDGAMALIKDIQVEPIHDKVLHVDFFRISKDHRIVVSVPIEVVGDAPAVKLEDCLLNQAVHEIEVECLPLEIPSVLTVDVSNLHAGQSINASALQLPPGVELRSDPSLSIVSAIHKREEEVPVAAAPEVAEGAEGAAAAASAAGGTAAPGQPAKEEEKKEKGKK